jgi:HNH endonuclease
MDAIRDWTKTLWVGKRPRRKPPTIDRALRAKLRMPGVAMERQLFLRDGHHCHYCGIPVIRRKIRETLTNLYLGSVPWAGGDNVDRQHAAFQGMQAVCDHLLAHSRGGKTTLENMVIACAPCNNGRECWTSEELGLREPSKGTRIRSAWDGLERLLPASHAWFAIPGGTK